MPLTQGKSKEAFVHNLKTEMKAGKPMNQSLAIAYATKKKNARKMAMGGHVHDEHCAEGCMMAEGGMVSEKASGYLAMPEEHEVMDEAAIHEDDKDLNEKGESEEFPYFHGGDVVDRVMRKKYSEGGMVANGGDDDFEKMADSKPNNFDDLALRDDLESSYTGENSGDLLGNAELDHDKADMVSRIMRSRAKRDRMPRPA